jgi:Kef-type K+ transport system membrane component KefB
MFESVFVQIGVILALAAAGGALAQLLKQPLIVVFIAIGIMVGPSGMGMVGHHSQIELFSRLGIALLLFVVGLKLDLHIIRTVGPVALASGLGQVFVTAGLGYLIALGLGISAVGALYVGLAITFSSTIIIVKLLSDKKEVDALHGRIAVGILIVQDVLVILVMIGLTAFGNTTNDVASIGQEAIVIIVKGLLMLAAVALLMRYILPRLLLHLANSSELLMLFAIAWAIGGAAMGDALGFSKEVGAFLAGVSIASTPYRQQVAARLVSLRDFLLLFFFIELGSNLDLGALGSQLVPALLVSVFVLIGKPVILMAIMGYMGYRKRTAFLAGTSMAQISEFSLILAALGLSIGHLDSQIVGLITFVGLITISASTYLIIFSHAIYEKLTLPLAVFERKIPHREPDSLATGNGDIEVLIVGLGRFGAALASILRHRGKNILAVDFDPVAVQNHIRDGYLVHYGDIEDPEFLGSLPLERTRWVISTIRDREINLMLLNGLREQHYKGRVAVSTYNHHEENWFKQQGVDMVLIPYNDAAMETANRLMA